METRSLIGSGRQGRCFGFMVNVRVSITLYCRVSKWDSVLQRGLERVYSRTGYSIPPHSPKTF